MEAQTRHVKRAQAINPVPVPSLLDQCRDELGIQGIDAHNAGFMVGCDFRKKGIFEVSTLY